MHRHMDLNGVMNSCQVYLMIFETRQHFKVFDSMFGTYSRYGSSQNRPGAGRTVQAEEHHHIYCMGSGLYTSDPPTLLRKRKLTDLGIDFSFNITLGILEIAVRYELKKAADNAQVAAYISEREEYNKESMNLTYAVNFLMKIILRLYKKMFTFRKMVARSK